MNLILSLTTKLILLIVLLLAFHNSQGQNAHLISLAESIESGPDTIKALYEWVAENIKYDSKKLESIKDRSIYDDHKGYDSPEAYKEHLLSTTIKKKKGVCEDYALLFDQLVKYFGYESQVISGYIRKPNGRIDNRLGHAWNAVKVGDSWQLFDCTWGAGYIDDRNHFVQETNYEWYQTPPHEMIKTHMPFDPIWQLLEYPITYEAFASNDLEADSSHKIEFQKLISDNLKLNREEQISLSIERSKSMGEGSRLVSKWQNYLQKSADYNEQRSTIDLLNETNDILHAGIDSWNQYIQARNKGLKAKKWTPEYQREVVFGSKAKIEKALGVYKEVLRTEEQFENRLKKTIINCEKLLDQIDNLIEREF